MGGGGGGGGVLARKEDKKMLKSVTHGCCGENCPPSPGKITVGRVQCPYCSDKYTWVKLKTGVLSSSIDGGCMT